VTRARTRCVWVGLVLLGLGPGLAQAQGYRLRLDSRVQRVSYRGSEMDSVRTEDVVTGPTGGPRTPDNFAVTCPPGSAYCFYFRGGPELTGGPMVTTADLTLWGLGVPGVSVRVNGRLGLDLDGNETWPGTEPAVQLTEAYAEYSRRQFTVRGGRQLLVHRFGYTGFDGGRGIVRVGQSGVEVDGYVGFGLARATALTPTSSALDPLDEFQPQSRQIVAGGALGYQGRLWNARLDYMREVDQDTRNFVSERTALTVEARPTREWSVAAGVDYDLANTWFGNADATVRYTTPRITVTGGLRQYRPFFDLWTLWGVFSPVPYHAADGALFVRPFRALELRARGERYVYSNTETETPLVDVDNDGWRLGFGATYSLGQSWRFDAGYREEYGPGASSHGFDGNVTWLPTTALSINAYGSTLDRPLEFRFNDASVDVLGVDAEWSAGPQLLLAVGGARYWETRDRPDAAAFDWNQTRLHARVTLLFRSQSDVFRLPPALRSHPRAGSR
jgi:hypothetical protein